MSFNIADLYKAQRDEVVGFYNELRQEYYDATGIEFQPTTYLRNRVAPTDEDRSWLRSIGINIDGVTDDKH
jgi:hypothetical protein